MSDVPNITENQSNTNQNPSSGLKETQNENHNHASDKSPLPNPNQNKNLNLNLPLENPLPINNNNKEGNNNFIIDNFYPPFKDTLLLSEEESLNSNSQPLTNRSQQSQQNQLQSQISQEQQTQNKFLTKITKDILYSENQTTLALFIKSSDLIQKIENESQLDKKKYDTEKLSYLIAENLNFIDVKKGEILFKIGEMGDRFYIILNGLVSVLKPKDVTESEDIIENHEKNYFFGIKRV